MFNGQRYSKIPNFVYPGIDKKKSTILTMLYEWKTDFWIEAGFSLNNRPKRAEDALG